MQTVLLKQLLTHTQLKGSSKHKDIQTEHVLLTAKTDIQVHNVLNKKICLATRKTSSWIQIMGVDFSILWLNEKHS